MDGGFLYNPSDIARLMHTVRSGEVQDSKTKDSCAEAQSAPIYTLLFFISLQSRRI
jgi:hypothetical protein